MNVLLHVPGGSLPATAAPLNRLSSSEPSSRQSSVITYSSAQVCSELSGWGWVLQTQPLFLAPSSERPSRGSTFRGAGAPV